MPVKGIEIEREARPITIFELKLLGFEGDEVKLEVHCKGHLYPLPGRRSGKCWAVALTSPSCVVTQVANTLRADADPGAARVYLRAGQGRGYSATGAAGSPAAADGHRGLSAQVNMLVAGRLLEPGSGRLAEAPKWPGPHDGWPSAEFHRGWRG